MLLCDELEAGDDACVIRWCMVEFAFIATHVAKRDAKQTIIITIENSFVLRLTVCTILIPKRGRKSRRRPTLTYIDILK